MAVLRVLVDESLPRSVGPPLEALGIDVVDARDVGLRGRADTTVFAKAQAESRVVLSADLDFANIVSFPLGTHEGIVVVRMPGECKRSDVANALVRALTGQTADGLRGCLVIVDERRVRIRR